MRNMKTKPNNRSLSNFRNMNSLINISDSSLNVPKQGAVRKYSDNKNYQSLMHSPVTKLKDESGSIQNSKFQNKAYVSHFEIDVTSQNSSVCRKNGDQASNISLNCHYPTLEHKLISKEKLEHRLRKEIKFLSEENHILKNQIKQMKVFVPVSLLGTNRQDTITDPKSWELTAKIMCNTKAKLSEKVQYLETIVAELIVRNQELQKNAIKALQYQCEENTKLETEIDIVAAKCEGYQTEIEKAILAERQAQDKLIEVTK